MEALSLTAQPKPEFNIARSPDRLPPHSPEAEQGILGCILLSPNDCLGQCVEHLPGPAAFYDFRHQTIYSALISMRVPIDTITLQEHLKAHGALENAGGIAYLSALPDTVPSAANLPYYLGIVHEKHRLRSLLHLCARTMVSIYEPGGTEALLDTFERDALAIRQEYAGAGESDIRAALSELEADYERAIREGKPSGLTTGFYDLDLLTGGLKPQQLMVIAARPSVGKTALALRIAERVAIDDHLPVFLFSLEMGEKELLQRLACSRAGVDCAALNAGRASQAEIAKLAHVHAQIKGAPLHLCDRGALTLAQLTALSRRIVQQHGIKLLVVDYLGLLRSGEKGRSRYEETTLVSNGLKVLAKELRVPLIALCQLNRDSERESREPRLSDLRDSGSIEQDADLVALLHRQESEAGDTQQVSLNLAKHRNGPTGRVKLIFRSAFARFESQSI